MQFLWWTTTKQMNMSSFFFQVNNHDSKNDIYNGIQNSSNIKMWAKTLTRGLWATSLTREFKSTNTYDYHNVDWEKKTPLFTFWEFNEFNGSSIEQTWIPFTQGCFEPNLVKFLKLANGSGEEYL